MKIFSAEPGDGSGNPGKILGINKKRIEVACSGGSVLINEMQMKGGKRMTVASYLNGHSIEIGETLE